MREWPSSSVEAGGDLVVVGCMVGRIDLEHWKSCSSCLGCRFCRCCWSLLNQSAFARSAWLGCCCLNNIVHYTVFSYRETLGIIVRKLPIVTEANGVSINSISHFLFIEC